MSMHLDTYDQYLATPLNKIDRQNALTKVIFEAQFKGDTEKRLNAISAICLFLENFKLGSVEKAATVTKLNQFVTIVKEVKPLQSRNQVTMVLEMNAKTIAAAQNVGKSNLGG